MNTFGEKFRITSWGESHGKAIGVVIDGCPSNIEISAEDIQLELDKRKPGQSEVTTSRQEPDKVEILSGIFEGKTLGTPISLIVMNHDQNSKDYLNLKDIFRPGHADYTYEKKYGIRDYRGGGRQSARETVARVAAGAIAKKYLKEELGIDIFGYVKQIGDLEAQNIDIVDIEKNPIRCPDLEISKKMESLIQELKAKGDSIGGLVEIIARNVPAGLGEPVFDKINARLASALISINGVKSFEIGEKNVWKLKGSEYNDEFINDDGDIRTKTNNHGGILGGITSGEDIIVRIGVKPTSSIARKQNTLLRCASEGQAVNSSEYKKTTIEIKGRHDPCLAPRLVPIAESMVALVIMDFYLLSR